MGYCVMRLNSDLNFGKYRGKQVSVIIESDPKYIVWALENTNSHPSQELLNRLSEKGFKCIPKSKARPCNKRESSYLRHNN